MTETATNLDDREATLAAFDRALAGFLDAYRPVPDDALTYVPPGEDYTLGGLVVHVMDVIDHYTLVLERMVAAGYGQVRVVDPDDDRARRDALIRNGFGAGERGGVFSELEAAHRSLVARMRALAASDYVRKAPVFYGSDATEPYETRPADIMGWLLDHYQEHITQSGVLLGDWKRSRATGSV